MKRKIILIGLLCLWLLAFCTLFSAWNQQQMTPLVALDSSASGTNRVSLDCLTYDETGRHLYTVIEKTGWSSGLQAHEVSPENYQVNESSVTLYDFGEPILYSSKPLQDGCAVEILRGTERGDDRWLVLSEGQAKVYDVENVSTPFLPSRALHELSAQGINSEQITQIYSLNEVDKFYASLPKLAALGGVFIAAILLWLCSFLLSKNAKKHKKILFFNAALMVAGLGISAVLLSKIDLPSSLLPQNNIFDFAHYREEVGEISAGNILAIESLL